MTADDGGRLQLSGGDHLAHPAPDAAGLDAHHLAGLDVGGDGVVGAAQAGGGDGQLLQPQLLDGGAHDHVHHVVPIPEMVVEGEGHAAFRPAVPKGLGDGVHHLAFPGLFIPAGPGGGLLHVPAVHIIFALIHLSAAAEQRIRNVTSNRVSHTKSPSYMPQAFARRRVRSAPGMKAMSIILPSRVKTPTPASACSR